MTTEGVDTGGKGGTGRSVNTAWSLCGDHTPYLPGMTDFEISISGAGVIASWVSYKIHYTVSIPKPSCIECHNFGWHALSCSRATKMTIKPIPDVDGGTDADM